MTLSERQSELLRHIRNLEMSGQKRFIYDVEAQELSNLGLAEAARRRTKLSADRKRLEGFGNGGGAVVLAGGLIERKHERT